jgi:hypothetical protein
MLTGRTTHPPGFRDERETRPTHWPAIASIVGAALPSSPRRNNLPPAIVLPEKLVHWSGGTIPGAYGGLMGRRHDPLFIEASPYGNPMWRGAYPEYTFPNSRLHTPSTPDDRVFQAPNIALAPGLNADRLTGRLDLLRQVDQQRQTLERSATTQNFDEHRQSAITLLADPRVRRAFDVTRADARTQERYGRNSFGWSLLMAFRLVEAGVNMIQVNLGNNETWDMHGDIFPRLRDKLFPPTDRALCALIDDLRASGALRQHLDRHGQRIRPDAAALDLGGCVCRPWPGPLGSGAERLLRGRRHQGRHRDRLVRSPRRLSSEQPAVAREHGRDDLSRPRHPEHGHVARHPRSSPPRLQRRADCRFVS